MTITCSDDKIAEWENFKRNGGKISFEIDASDIDTTKNFEKDSSIQPRLKTGFELPPSTSMESSEHLELIHNNGSKWVKILCSIHLANGKIIYKQLENGKYEAICSAPEVQ